MLGSELVPFMCSGSHVIQKDCHPSAIHTFVESLALCMPPVPIRPSILKVSTKFVFGVLFDCLGCHLLSWVSLIIFGVNDYLECHCKTWVSLIILDVIDYLRCY